MAWTGELVRRIRMLFQHRQFQQDLEELRVQTFAQELGTRRSVSHKRLARALLQLD